MEKEYVSWHTRTTRMRTAAEMAGVMVAPLGYGRVPTFSHPTDFIFGDGFTRFALPEHWHESDADGYGRIVAFDATGCGSVLVRCHDGSFAVVPVPALRSDPDAGGHMRLVDAVAETKRIWRENAERDGGVFRPDLDDCVYCGANAYVFACPAAYQCFGCCGCWLGEDWPDFPRHGG